MAIRRTRSCVSSLVPQEQEPLSNLERLALLLVTHGEVFWFCEGFNEPDHEFDGSECLR